MQLRQEGLECFYRRSKFTVNGPVLKLGEENGKHTIRACLWDGRNWAFSYRSLLLRSSLDDLAVGSLG
jgi:hypothetical protein